ncbi:MAG TPA: cryptochrome/photolyase family protein [Candidatus Anammoximicrobium sp.]|nr:cryptochrome/photolyase family protein [Candidatus Anammoximicrobium sp.]
MRAALIYPHQLFEAHPALRGAEICVLVEEPLLLTQYRFHRQKLILHRASMQHFAERLRRRKQRVHYVECGELGATGQIAAVLTQLGVTHAQFVDPCDDWLQQRLTAALAAARIGFTVLDDPHFLTPWPVFEEFAAGRKRLFFTDFYVLQRKRLGLLLDDRGRPVGGKWSYDPENRKKLPRDASVPPIAWPASSAAVREAQDYVRSQFAQAVGDGDAFHYPVTPEQARSSLDDFLEHRLVQFGQYEDAIHADETFLFHSVLTPALNVGLISPRQVIDAALERADRVPLNSLEGFVRQIIGWREYMRGVYRLYGRRQRTRNYWNHHRPMPAAFYDGTTGVEPVDTVIRRVLRYAYCHHIERLMILGNFMLLCEIHPAAIYQWFMELFIDAYDWVMVPNVFGMSQHADGGLITTKPYLSGSSYVLKMSNFRKGPWCAVWDALYWRFIDRHREFFAGNPRMSVMVAQCDRMGSRLEQHRRTAEQFLRRLHGEA